MSFDNRSHKRNQIASKRRKWCTFEVFPKLLLQFLTVIKIIIITALKTESQKYVLSHEKKMFKELETQKGQGLG